MKNLILFSLAAALSLFGCEKITAPETGTYEPGQPVSGEYSFQSSLDLGEAFIEERQESTELNQYSCCEKFRDAPLQGELEGRLNVELNSTVNTELKQTSTGKHHGTGTLILMDGREIVVSLEGYSKMSRFWGRITGYAGNGSVILTASYSENGGSKPGDVHRNINVRGIMKKIPAQNDERMVF